MLVLSACHTAWGSEEVELGFAGLAAKAGVKTVLGTLWRVSDFASLVLVMEFYAHLKTTSSRAEALRQAQLSLLQEKFRIEGDAIVLSNGMYVPVPEGAKRENTFTHPFFWSGFELIGNWR